jgi:cytochrome c oxidase subunit II
VSRGAVLWLIFLTAIFSVITTAVAVLIPWLPVQASDQAVRINFVYWFMTVIAIVVFSLVAAVLVYAIWKFRVKPGDTGDGPPIHGHTGLEITWTAIPFVLVTALAIVSAIVLSKNSDAGNNPLRVKVIGQQFWWQFQYEQKGQFAGPLYPILRLPEGKTVEFTITARDVLHSFWVPQFFQKQDAVPGLPTDLVVTPNRTGTFPVICVELCGLGHSLMRSEVIVMPPAAFDTWLTKANSAPATTAGGGASTGGSTPAGGSSAAGGSSSASTAGLAVFNANGCNACHKFAPANANGAIGPDLDKLKEEAQTAGQPLQAFIEQSIVDPEAYIEPGYPKGTMPGNFKSTIPPDKLAQLVQYLTENTG